MAKKQTRRSVSLNHGEFDAAVAAAKECGVSLSRFTEVALRALIAAKPSPALFAVTRPAVGMTVADIKQAVEVLDQPENRAALAPGGVVMVDVDPASVLAKMQPELDARVGVLNPRPTPAIDALIARSSIGAGLANIRKNGIDAELRDLADEMHGNADEVRVVYDEET